MKNKSFTPLEILKYKSAKNRNCNKFLTGFTLLEVIIAIFIILIALLAAIFLVANTTAATSVYKQQLIAAYLAQEGIELVRHIRDTNWITGEEWTEGKLNKCNPYQNKYCEAEHDPGNLTVCNTDLIPPSCSGEPRFLKISDTSSKFYNYSFGTNTIFKRKVYITPQGDDVLLVSVEVSWQAKGETHKFTAQEKIYNWH